MKSSIVVVGDPSPSFPEDFNRRLQAFDKDLWITWHKSPASRKPGCWKIEMCVEHNGRYRVNAMPEHDHLCRRIYVMMVQDEEGTPMPLGDHVFAKLGEMRANCDSFGGPTERGLKNFKQYSDSLDKELAEKRERESRDLMDYNRRDHRVQLNTFWNLIERHDMRPNR